MSVPADSGRSPSAVEFYRFTLGLGPRAVLTNLELFRSVEYTWLLDGLDVLRSKTVLDYACWTSYLPAYFAAQGAAVLAIDVLAGIREQERRRARRRWRGAWLNVAAGPSTARDLPVSSDSVDVAYAVSSLDHLPGDLDAAGFRELLRVTKPGGTVFLTVPYGSRYVEGTFAGWLQKRYDWASLQEKFLGPAAGLPLDVLFFGDRRTRSWTARYWKLPRVARIATRRLQFPIALRLLARDAAHQGDATLVGIRVRKEAKAP